MKIKPSVAAADKSGANPESDAAPAKPVEYRVLWEAYYGAPLQVVYYGSDGLKQQKIRRAVERLLEYEPGLDPQQAQRRATDAVESKAICSKAEAEAWAAAQKAAGVRGRYSVEAVA